MTDGHPIDNLMIERTFDAPPEMVWRMWAEPEHFAAWYGPGGAGISVVDMDVREGGTRLLRMDVTTPDGSMQMWFAGQYLKVVDHEQLVYTDAMSDEHGTILTSEQSGMPEGHPSVTEVHVVLEPAGSGTKMTLTHVGIPAGSPGAAGWSMALDKLATHLEELSIT